ncbi:MAG: tetratricopeptide repeat protein [Pseudomonadota bacterium]
MLRRLAIVMVPLIAISAADAHAGSCAGAGEYLLERYAQNGDPQAQFQLSEALSAEGCQQEAMRWLQRAVAQDHAEATFILGIRYITGTGVAEDLLHGLDLLEKAARIGHLEAQFQYAMVLLDSSASHDHRDQALYWLGAAASQGDTKAALTLGHIYAAGLHGIEQHACQASDWFEAAMLLARDVNLDVSNLIPDDLRCDT